MLGDLTEAELRWTLNKDAMHDVFGISKAYKKNLSDFHRHLSVNDYVKVKTWIKSYVHKEEDKPKVDILLDSLLLK